MDRFCCDCGEPLTMELERDLGICVDCHRAVLQPAFKAVKYPSSTFQLEDNQ
jgi:NMD protein affecting ribosome stability and mRNA decay